MGLSPVSLGVARRRNIWILSNNIHFCQFPLVAIYKVSNISQAESQINAQCKETEHKRK